MKKYLAIILSSVLSLAASQALGQPKMRRIGLISPGSPTSMAPRTEALRKGLHDLGYTETDIAIEYRWGEGKDHLIPQLVSELLKSGVSVVLTHGVLATRATRNASSDIPIVCFDCGDLVAANLVHSLAKPGGNVTGVTLVHPEMTGKRLELLKEFVPGLARVGLLYNATNPVAQPELRLSLEAANILGLQVIPVGITDPGDIEAVLTKTLDGRVEGMMVLSDAALLGRQKEIARVAAALRLPTILWTGDYARIGGLVGYGPDGVALAYRAATYVDKILKGARPMDLPVEEPTTFNLVINATAARALGLVITPALALRADEIVD